MSPGRGRAGTKDVLVATNETIRTANFKVVKAFYMGFTGYAVAVEDEDSCSITLNEHKSLWIVNAQEALNDKPFKLDVKVGMS